MTIIEERQPAGSVEQKPPVEQIKKREFEVYEDYLAYRDSFKPHKDKAVLVTARITHKVVVFDGKEMSVQLSKSLQYEVYDQPAVILAVSGNEVYIETIDESGQPVIVGSLVRFFSAELAVEPDIEEEAVDS